MHDSYILAINVNMIINTRDHSYIMQHLRRTEFYDPIIMSFLTVHELRYHTKFSVSTIANQSKKFI